MEGMFTEKEIIEKYGEIELEFSNYYKYGFSYINNEHKIYVHFGGNSDDIYKSDLVNKMKLTKLMDESDLTIEIDGIEIYTNVIW